MCAKTDILTTLTYFDIFHYPVTQTEIFFFLRNHYSQEEYLDALQDLVKEKQVFQFEELYSLQDDYQLLFRRRKGNAKARKLMETAVKVSAFLSLFPFVRGVAISGSLSKNYADETSDIDFFIITVRNRLWIARTFLHLFKKLTFLFQKQQLFCMNYFVDEEGQQIKEKNIYTATELATLLPMRGIEAFRQLYQQNQWSRSFLPNHSMKVSYTKEVSTSPFKKIIEWIFNNPAGNATDNLLMKITAWRWSQKTKQQKRNANGNVMGMDASKHCSKPDPCTFQKNFITVLEKSVAVTLHKYYHRLKPVV